ncbi:hypothetical protein GCM10010358_83280 [Streptomyces minutiscleroticus]|uniref:Uncharacterized protein n=1 Tax=Streptomyces minutiscleroticus TaxID=68238 RepID=A0A918P5P5_9ACTN|nr:hypothetical protein GCM10010358_83280 [Streptomyces minutiscleroticus]
MTSSPSLQEGEEVNEPNLHGPVWWRCGHTDWETLDIALTNPDDYDAYRWRNHADRRRASEIRKQRAAETEAVRRRREAGAWSCLGCGRSLYPHPGLRAGDRCATCACGLAEPRAAPEAAARPPHLGTECLAGDAHRGSGPRALRAGPASSARDVWPSRGPRRERGPAEGGLTAFTLPPRGRAHRPRNTTLSATASGPPRRGLPGPSTGYPRAGHRAWAGRPRRKRTAWFLRPARDADACAGPGLW